MAWSEPDTGIPIDDEPAARLDRNIDVKKAGRSLDMALTADKANRSMAGGKQGDADSYQLSGGLGFLLRLANARLNNLYAQNTSQFDITPRQFAVLVTLHQRGALSLTELAEHIRVDRSTLSEMLNRMVDRALIAKSPDAVDGRSSRLKITEGGRQKAMALVPIVEDIHATLLSGIPAGDRATFLSCLKIVGGA